MAGLTTQMAMAEHTLGNALAALGCPSNEPSLARRNLVVVGDGALAARPHHMKEGKYVDFPKGGEAIFLESLQALKPGGGAQALKALCEIADKLKVPIILIPTGYATALRPSPLSVEELTAYYTRFGFQPLRSVRPGKWLTSIMVRAS